MALFLKSDRPRTAQNWLAENGQEVTRERFGARQASTTEHHIGAFQEIHLARHAGAKCNACEMLGSRICRHFTIDNPQDSERSEIVAPLCRIADALDELRPVFVHDITLGLELDDGFVHDLTSCFSPDDVGEARWKEHSECRSKSHRNLSRTTKNACRRNTAQPNSKHQALLLNKTATSSDSFPKNATNQRSPL